MKKNVEMLCQVPLQHRGAGKRVPRQKTHVNLLIWRQTAEVLRMRPESCINPLYETERGYRLNSRTHGWNRNEPEKLRETGATEDVRLRWKPKWI